MLPHAVAHTASVMIAVPASRAFTALTSAGDVGRWALGSTDLQPTQQANVYQGVSLFDGSRTHVEIRGYADLGLIDYHVGNDRQRIPRITIRIAPDEVSGAGPEHCLVAMTAWRAAGMSESDWARLCTLHEAEILLMKAQMEAAFEAAPDRESRE